MVEDAEARLTAGFRESTESESTASLRVVPGQSHSDPQSTPGPPTQTTSGTHLNAVGNSGTGEESPFLGPQPSNSVSDDASLHTLDTPPAVQAHPPIAHHHAHSPSGVGLRLRTDLIPRQDTARQSTDQGNAAPMTGLDPTLDQNPSTSGIPIRTGSVKAALHASGNTAGSLSPASALSSPGLGPMVAITPLPSPIMLTGSWKRTGERSGSRGSMSSVDTLGALPNRENTSSIRRSPKKRRAYQGISTAASEPFDTYSQNPLESASNHGRNRSLSEYVPEAVSIPRPRNIVVSGSGGPPSIETFSAPTQHLHREEYLAVQRGLAAPVPRPPTPPRSHRNSAESDDGATSVPRPLKSQSSLPLSFEARTIKRNAKRRWRAVRQLGKGSFSEVMLATSQGAGDGTESKESGNTETLITDEQHLDPKTLVAVKIVEHGPSGGPSEERMETSLKRELEVLKLIDHPSLVHLKAFNTDEKQALLVLNYCPGGDLFELASLKHDLLLPGLIRRIFAELVAAVRYLHAQYIVHRDIKLESTLHLSMLTPLLRFFKRANPNQTSSSTSLKQTSPQSQTGNTTTPPSSPSPTSASPASSPARSSTRPG